MRAIMNSNPHLTLIAPIVAVALLTSCADQPSMERPQLQAESPAPSSTKKLPRTAGEPVAVAIYEFRSSVDELAARGTTDMFVTAITHNGTFRVVERAQMERGLLIEKQLNS